MQLPTDARLQKGADSAVRVLLPAAAAVATVPPALVGLDASTATLPALAVAPCLALVLTGLGLTAVVAYRLVGLGARRAPALGLLGALVVLAEAVTVGVDLGPSPWLGLVHGAAGGAVAGAGLLGVVAWRRWRRGVVPGALRWRFGSALAVLVLLALTRASVPAWLVALGLVVMVLFGGPVLVARLRAGVSGPAPDPVAPVPAAPDLPDDDPYATIVLDAVPPAPVSPLPSTPVGAGSPESPAPVGAGLRVVHLGLTDPAAGGPDAVADEAAADVLRRVAARGHHLTVVSPRFPGARDRTERHGDGTVRWRHPGLGGSRVGRVLGYAAGAVVAVRVLDADLVVEELASPIPLAVPRWARRPVVGVATTLPRPVSAGERAPLRRLAWWAVRSHHSIVAPSADVAHALDAAGVRADVAVVGDGVPSSAGSRAGGDDVVCLGSLETGRGLEAVVHGWARAAAGTDGTLVLVGSGPDEARLRRWVASLGLEGRVSFVGDLCGPERRARTASARAVVVAPAVPARSARVLALEALAAGSPVIGSDTAALPPDVELVSFAGPEDAQVAAVASALAGLPGGERRWVGRGRAAAHTHDRDDAADQREDVYLAAVARADRSLSRR